MSVDTYKLYRKDVFRLAKTLVIKSSFCANVNNNNLKAIGVQVNDQYPETWKYYLNLSGEYHSTDEVMYILSLDTLQTIAFTKENLAVHKTTRAAYYYGSTEFNQLVSLFPNQLDVINGILNPVDIETAIAAEEGAILFYDSSLVEDNEINLIHNLETWTKNYFQRRAIYDYSIVDDYYGICWFGVFGLALVKQILNLRTANCHTQFAHSYHITEYLASKGGRDIYIPVLTKKQILFLYRNIDWIERNVGKQGTFEVLLQRLLTERGFPLAQYLIAHNTSNLPTDIVPSVNMVRQPINFTKSFGLSDVTTVANVLAIQRDQAKGNSAVESVAASQIPVQAAYAQYNSYKTKVLESSIIDDTNQNFRTLAETILHHWLYLSANNYYRAVINFNNPVTGVSMSLGALDAFTLFLHCSAKALSIDLEDIPGPYARFVVLDPSPSFTELRSKTDTKWVYDSDITFASADIVNGTVLLSIEDFYLHCSAIQDRMKIHYHQYLVEGDYRRKGEVQKLVESFYGDVSCPLTTETHYSAWLTNKGIVTTGWIDTDYATLANSILNEATGHNLNTVLTLSDIHSAVVDLMASLSSYTVQYISNTITESIIPVITAQATLSETRTKLSGTSLVNLDPELVLSNSGALSAVKKADKYPFYLLGKARFANRHKTSILHPVNLTVKALGSGYTLVNVPLIYPSVTQSTVTMPTDYSGFVWS